MSKKYTENRCLCLIFCASISKTLIVYKKSVRRRCFMLKRQTFLERIKCYIIKMDISTPFTNIQNATKIVKHRWKCQLRQVGLQTQTYQATQWPLKAETAINMIFSHCSMSLEDSWICNSFWQLSMVIKIQYHTSKIRNNNNKEIKQATRYSVCITTFVSEIKWIFDPLIYPRWLLVKDTSDILVC